MKSISFSLNPKVCLSILGTWSGPKWTSIMDISTVLLCIQSLLDNNPLHHEPGQEQNMGNTNTIYNQIIGYNTIQSLITDNLKRIPIGFEDFKESLENGGWDLSKVTTANLKESKATFVFGQMNEPPGARARVALSGLTIAEYFRDGDGTGKGRDILFFVDNIFRFTQAGSEVSALLGRMPSAVGYQPTLATEMGVMQERITSTKNGSITSVQAVYVPADDLTDPAPATTFSHLDATTVLSRKISELGILSFSFNFIKFFL